jgi:hypothetical protein
MRFYAVRLVGEVVPQTESGRYLERHRLPLDLTLQKADAIETIQRIQGELMIVGGIILLLIGYLLPIPMPLAEIVTVIGWILLIVGVVLLILGSVGRPVAGRRYWF